MKKDLHRGDSIKYLAQPLREYECKLYISLLSDEYSYTERNTSREHIQDILKSYFSPCLGERIPLPNSLYFNGDLSDCLLSISRKNFYKPSVFFHNIVLKDAHKERSKSDIKNVLML